MISLPLSSIRHSLWFVWLVTRFLPTVKKATSSVLELQSPPTIPISDTLPEATVEIIKETIDNSPKEVVLKSNTKNQVRTWSAQYCIEVAKELTDATALLRGTQYSKISQHIEKYIEYIMSSTDSQYTLVSLRQLRERLDIFAKQNTPEKLKSSTTLYSPPSDEVYSWLRDSPYRMAQGECIKTLDMRSHAIQVLSGYAWAMDTAISKIAGSSPDMQQALKKFKEWKDAISSSVCMAKIYKEYFGKLDSNIVWVLYQWDILDPRLDAMLDEYFAWKKQPPKISATLKELLYINLIYRRRTPHIDASQ